MLCCTQFRSLRLQSLLSDKDLNFQSIPIEDSHSAIPKNLKQYKDVANTATAS